MVSTWERLVDSVGMMQYGDSGYCQETATHCQEAVAEAHKELIAAVSSMKPVTVEGVLGLLYYTPEGDDDSCPDCEGVGIVRLSEHIYETCKTCERNSEDVPE